MIKKISFNDTGKKVHVTIDNESADLPIKSIVKTPTCIQLNKSINTPLFEDIVIDAILCYISNTDMDNIDVEEEDNNTAFLIPTDKEMHIVNTDGVANIKIYNDEKTYYKDSVTFYKGTIKANISNTLPLGEYVCQIQYTGNKYFEACEVLINFNIERRLTYCIFDTDTVSGHLTETLGINGILKDSLTNKEIGNCILKYDFNGHTYESITNGDGSFLLTITIPDGHILHCSQYALEENSITIQVEDRYKDEYDEGLIRDEDGNIVFINDKEENITAPEDVININQNLENNFYPADNDPAPLNASYLITLNADSDTYYVNDSIIVNVIKASTHIDINTGEYNQTNRTVNFNGHVVADIDDNAIDVHYGKVQINLLDFNYTHDLVKVDSYGIFDTNIDMATVYALYNNTDIDELMPYQGYNGIYNTSLNLNVQYEQGTTIQVGEPIIAEVNIKTVTNDLVTEGMVKFDLYYDTEKVYSYATELDDLGIGVFSFNTTRKGNYTLKAKYCGLFGYHDSTKETKIKVN